MELTFRVIHIFCGVFWAGAAVMLAAFIEPAVSRLGPDGGKFMERLMGPGRFGVFMSLAGLLTVGSGAALLWLGAGTGLATWWDSGYGRAIVIGAIPGVVALVSGLSVNAPTAARLARIAQDLQAAGAPPRPEQLSEIARLQRRLHIAGIVSALLLSASVVAMAAARYM